MGILEFIREYLDIRRESRSYCKSCEVLREQLSVVNFEKKQLMDNLLVKPAPVQVEHVQPEPIAPKMVPWHIKRQMLEEQDRALAATIRRQKEDAAKAVSNSEISVEELEKELAIGSEE